MDSNPGLTEQLDLMNKYHVQTLLLAGDFEYTDGKAVLDDLTKHGFNKNNSDIVVGNHDSAKDVNSWLDTDTTFGKYDFAQGKITLQNCPSSSAVCYCEERTSCQWTIQLLQPHVWGQ